MLKSFTKKRKWRQKIERTVNSAKDGPNIAVFAAKSSHLQLTVGYCFECKTVRPVTESLIASRYSYEEVDLMELREKQGTEDFS